MRSSNSAWRFLWWFATGLWIAIIFATLRYVPVWRDWIAARFTETPIVISVIAILVAVFGVTVIRMVRQGCLIRDYLFLAIFGAGYAYSLSRISIVVEQVHFIEYGLLAYLIISALRVDWRDSGQYVTALLVITLVGVADEYVQGTLVNRVGELRDVFLNILSGALALAWFRYGVKPVELAADWRATTKLALPVIGLIILGIGIFNSRISEFGYYITDPEIGEFHSRLSEEQLKSGVPDGRRFQEQILPQLYHGSYAELVHRLKGTTDGEVLVHIFSRDKHLERGDYYTAHRENQILEKYFPGYIIGTSHQWSEDKKAEVKTACAADLGDRYVSSVSAQIITAYSQSSQWIVICVLETLIALIWLAMFLRQHDPDRADST